VSIYLRFASFHMPFQILRSSAGLRVCLIYPALHLLQRPQPANEHRLV
jgi:hypothetical protein